MKIAKISLMLLILAGILIAGCGPKETPVDTNLLLTNAIETVNAALKETAMAYTQAPPVPSDTPQLVLPTDTLVPTMGQSTSIPLQTMAPTNTLPSIVQPTATTKPAGTVPCNRAAFIQDVTYPDNTKVNPGERFTKTWRLQNTGTCTWNEDYQLVFVSGDLMGADKVIKFPKDTTVFPQGTIDLSVKFDAPTVAGTYTGNWKLASDTDETFGLGDFNAAFWVTIVVSSGTPEPTSTGPSPTPGTTTPTPTYSGTGKYKFTISVANVHNCGGDTVVALMVTNTGDEFFQSMAAGTIRNLTENVLAGTIPASNDPFLTSAGSCDTSGASDLDPNEIYYILANLGANPDTDKYRFTVTLCSNDGSAGTCVTNEVVYKLD